MNMKFLLKLVSCFYCCCTNSRGYSRGKEQKSLLGGGLAQPESRGLRGLRRARIYAGAGIAGGRRRRNSGSAIEWRPSLSSISEENVMPVRNEQLEARVKLKSSKSASSARNLRRKFSSASRASSRLSFDDVVGRNSQHMSMPTLSPAPFMF